MFLTGVSHLDLDLDIVTGLWPLDLDLSSVTGLWFQPFEFSLASAWFSYRQVEVVVWVGWLGGWVAGWVRILKIVIAQA